MKHQSTSSKYRNPLGALKNNSSVEIAFDTSNDGCSVELCVHGPQGYQQYPMHFANKLWRYELNVDVIGALFYHFLINIEGETIYYGVKYGKRSGLGQYYHNNPIGFQITVYHQDFITPTWFAKSVMYQIFPDRFRPGKPENLVNGEKYHRDMGRDVYIHESWQESPIFAPINGNQYYAPCDYFGGDLKGIEDSLDYLSDLGVSCIYLNPIVEADSNHRYNTADYRKVDPFLGDMKDFNSLCEKAKAKDIRLILDGVYSHTGADSIYFNKNVNYNVCGAYQGSYSPYYSWYDFNEDCDNYRSWWGFKSLPEVNEYDENWQNFIIKDKDSILNYWLRNGASGFRLDVADELPDEIIALMRETIKKSNKDHVLIGEVWEDAIIKEGCDGKRQYALGSGLDTVMNYPFKDMCINYLNCQMDAYDFQGFLLNQQENYPAPMYYALMNLLSSHDVARIRTILATKADGSGMSTEKQASYVINNISDKEGAKLSLLAMAVQFMIPGVPSIYYGDEFGMHGFKDPHNRKSMHQNDEEIHGPVRQLANLRNEHDALKGGHASFEAYNEDVLGILRFIVDERDVYGEIADNSIFIVLVNRGEKTLNIELVLDKYFEGISLEQIEKLKSINIYQAIDLVNDEYYEISDNKITVPIEGYSYQILKMKYKKIHIN